MIPPVKNGMEDVGDGYVVVLARTLQRGSGSIL